MLDPILGLDTVTLYLGTVTIDLEPCDAMNNKGYTI